MAPVPVGLVMAESTAVFIICAELGFTTPGIVNMIKAPAAKSLPALNVTVRTF